MLLGADFLVSWVFRLRRYSLKDLIGVFGCLAVLPAAAYLAAYGQYFAMGYTWRDFIELQHQMWLYHTGMAASHPYQSTPWQWLLNVRPVWLYAHNRQDGRVANIYNLGNSVVLYFGLVAMAALAMRQFRRPIWPALFLLAGYLILWAPWSLSPRLMFFYHYLPAVPLLCVASGLLLDRWQANRHRWIRVAAWSVVGLSAAWFIFFFPHMTAISVPPWWANSAYYWIPSWR
jgi:dolichyl-phosphate-mannose--protein O-mannosyl transferase